MEAVRKHGKENVILLNHDITPKVEDEDIKRFKQEVADYLGLDITYANHERWNTATPVQVCKDAKAWKVDNGTALCTNRLKTAPFKDWLQLCDPNRENVYIYGFDNNPKEMARATRRTGILGSDGYKTDYPLITWERTISSTTEIGIEPPLLYNRFVHANCIGCLKAGWQHWYIVYCERPDIWEEAKEAEEAIGYAIHKDKDGAVYLEDKEELFELMKIAGVEPSEHVHYNKFWPIAKRKAAEVMESIKLVEMDELAEHDDGVCLDCMA
nr:hypothetical protein BCU03_09535 [Vibrio breoganii]